MIHSPTVQQRRLADVAYVPTPEAFPDGPPCGRMSRRQFDVPTSDPAVTLISYRYRCEREHGHDGPCSAVEARSGDEIWWW